MWLPQPFPVATPDRTQEDSGDTSHSRGALWELRGPCGHASISQNCDGEEVWTDPGRTNDSQVVDHTV